MIDFKSLGLQVGQKLRIKTKNGIILGKFKNLSPDGKRLQISNPQRLDESSLGKIMRLLQSDVKDIVAERLDTNELSIAESETKAFNPTITKIQSERIQAMINETVYIYQANSSYFKALEAISGSFVIGLNAENGNQGRLARAEFLQVSTGTKLYVFDLRQLKGKHLFDGLRTVLENHAYLKISFDCRFLIDNLCTHYNLKVSPVCDLMVVMNIERQSIAFQDINQCVKEIFGVNIDRECDNVWRRPINNDQLERLGSKVAFLIPLYFQLNKLKLLDKYEKAIQEYSTMTEKDFFNEIFSRKNGKIKSIIREFRNEERHG